VVQIEVDRSLYMNEQLIRPNGNFATFQKILTGVIARIVDMGARDQRLAAE
jgi:N-formylglutamate amidohydrolase